MLESRPEDAQGSFVETVASVAELHSFLNPSLMLMLVFFYVFVLLIFFDILHGCLSLFCCNC